MEVELNGTVIQTKDFQWDLNLTHYKNKVTSLPDERKTMVVDGVGGFSSGNYMYGEGIPLYTFYMYKYAGVDENGNALYYRDVTAEDGTVTQTTTTNPSEATMHLCGTALPDVYGGFGTSLSYKGFDLSLAFTYQIGGQVYDGDYASMMGSPLPTDEEARSMQTCWTLGHRKIRIRRYRDSNTVTCIRQLLPTVS